MHTVLAIANFTHAKPKLLEIRSPVNLVQRCPACNASTAGGRLVHDQDVAEQ